MVKKSKSIYTAPITIEGHWNIEGVCANGEKRNYHFFEKMTHAMNHDNLIKLPIAASCGVSKFVES